MKWNAVALMALCSFACVPRRDVALHTLVRDGYENEILAVEEYRHQRLWVSGTIEDRGLKTQRELQTDIGFISEHGSDATSKWVKKKYPFVMLVTQGEFRARLLCKYDDDMRQEVGMLDIGQDVTVVGDFAGYRQTRRGKIAVLKDCDVEN